jgi:hypothetical protein
MSVALLVMAGIPPEQEVCRKKNERCRAAPFRLGALGSSPTGLDIIQR